MYRVQQTDEAVLLETETEMIEAVQKIKEDANQASSQQDGKDSLSDSKPHMVRADSSQTSSWLGNSVAGRAKGHSTIDDRNTGKSRQEDTQGQGSDTFRLRLSCRLMCIRKHSVIYGFSPWPGTASCRYRTAATFGRYGLLC